MTGGGFGGSIIALVNKGQGHEIAQKIADRFEKEGFNAPRALPAFAAASASREADRRSRCKNARWRTPLKKGRAPTRIFARFTCGPDGAQRIPRR